MRSRIRAEILKRVTAAGLASVVFTGMGCGDSCEKRSARPEAKHVLRHRRLRYGEAELQQFAVDSWCAPERIGAADPPNQISQLRTNRGPTRPSATVPRPVASKSLPVPADHRLRPHQLQRLPPTRPQPRQQNPEDSVHLPQPRPRLARRPHGELLPKRRFSSASSRCVRRELLSVPKRIASHRTMTGHIADQLPECKLIAADDFLEGTGSISVDSRLKNTGSNPHGKRPCVELRD
jgi:hypothetical protein